MSTSKGSVRLKRIASEILHEISQYTMTQLDDPRLKQAQLNRVEVSKDLSHAKVYFTVTDPSIDIKNLTQALNNVSNIFHYHIAKTLNLRITPHIKFYYDEQAVKTIHLLDVLSKL